MPSRAMAFDGGTDPGFAEREALAEVRRMTALDWADILRSPAIARLTGAVADGVEPAPGYVDAALDALPSALPGAVAVRDHATGRRRTRVVTVATAKPHLCLLDVALAVAGRKVVLRIHDTGVNWTVHAMARRYERVPGTAGAGPAIGGALARRGSLLRLACRVAATVGDARFPVPTDDGLLLGATATPSWMGGPTMSGCMVFRPGATEVAPVQPSGPAADGNRWTAVTFVPDRMLHQGHAAESNAWMRMAGIPEVAALDELPDWNGGEGADGLVAAAMDAVGDDLLAYVTRDVARTAATPESDSVPGGGGWPGP